MISKRLAILSFCFVLAQFANAQVRIELNAPDSLPFLVEVNASPINVRPCVKMVFDADTSGKCLFNIQFPANPNLNFEQSITLKKNSWSAFDIGMAKGNLKLILGSESSFTPIHQPASSVEPTATADTELAPGCDKQAGTAEFEFMIDETHQVAFESRKLEVMKKFLESYCVRCEQLRFMIAQLSQEDYKLALIQSAVGHLADPTKLHHLADDFFLERNKQVVLDIATAQSSK
ncbi:MAG: DUF4476 domain-containing protein [Flavobacteriales bacterium]